jgi:hypothetical protein
MNTATRTAPRISEGTHTARQILRSVPPMTSDPLALHRIDTSQIPRDAGCAVGHMAIKPAPRPLLSINCCGKADCKDRHCEGRNAALLRAEDDEERSHVDPAMRRRVWIGLIAWCAVFGLALASLLIHTFAN